MDIEQVKKFNSMVKTLSKHGFIENNDAAFEMASKICEKGKPPELIKKEINNNIDEAELNSLIEKKVKQQIHVNNQKFENILNSVCTDLQKLITNNTNELLSLKKQFREISIEKQNPVQKQGVQQKIVVKEQKKEPHPRQGNYTSDDVALDKIFYYGQK